MTQAPCDDCYGFGYFKEITIDPSNVTSTLTNFPILVHTNLPTDHVSSASAWDTAFYLYSSGVCTLLKHDIHDWNDSTGTFWAWVQIPELDSAATMTLYLFYGKDGVGSDPSDPEVWTDAGYKSVWHLSDASGGAKDAAEYQDGTEQGAPGYQQPGKIGRCVEFDDANPDYFTITDGEWAWNNSDNYTIEIWFLKDDNNAIRPWSFTDLADGKPRVVSYNNPGTFKMHVDFVQGGGVEDLLESNDTMATNTWYHLVTKQDTSTGLEYMYINGIKQTDTDTICAYNLAGRSTPGDAIGTDAQNTAGQAWSGKLCEMRIHPTTALSDNWIWQCWRCADDPDTFAAVGAESVCTQSTPTTPDSCATFACDNSCGTFFIKGSSYTLYFGVPLANSGVDRQVGEAIKRFNFWDGDYAVTDDSKAGEPLKLSGIEYYICEDSTVVPDGYKAYWRFYCKFDYMSEMMDNNEKIQIYGIGDCTDALYVIKSFRYSTIPGVTEALAWELQLEYVRDLTAAEISAFGGR